MKDWKVIYEYGDKKCMRIPKQGTEVYRHPKNYFVTLEFQGKAGKFRESFRPSELMKVGA